MKRKRIIIFGIIGIFIISFVVINNLSKYPDDKEPSFKVNLNSIFVSSNQKDRIRFSNTSIKYRIKKSNGNYSEWKDNGEFLNLTENVYFIQTSIVDSKGKYNVSKEVEVHLYNGDLVNLEGLTVATKKGGLYTVPYYMFEQKHTHTEECPNSGRKAGVWGDSDLRTCSICGAKNVAIRTEEKVKYKTWNGYDAYRNVYVYASHNRTVTTLEYNYTYDKEKGIGNLKQTYYAKQSIKVKE